MSDDPTDTPDDPGNDVLTLAIAKLLEAGDADGARELTEHPEKFLAAEPDAGKVPAR